MLYCLITYIISAEEGSNSKVSFVVGSVVGAIMRAYNFYEVYGNFSTYIDIGYQSYCIYYLKVEYVRVKTLPRRNIL